MSDELIEVCDEQLSVEEVIREIAVRARERRREAIAAVAATEAGTDSSHELGLLTSNWDPEGALPAATRNRWLKRWLLWAIRPFSRAQTIFNAAAMQMLVEETERASVLSAQLRDADERLREAESSLESLRAGLDDAVRRLDESGTEALPMLRDSAAVLKDVQESLVRGQEALRHEMLLQRHQLEMLLHGIRRQPAGASAADAEQMHRQAHHLSYLTDHAFRGSDDELRQRLGIYVALFAERRMSLGASGPILEVGCRRGVLLEMLRESGVPAMGVEANQDHARLCRLKGLDVVEGDGLAYLSTVPDDSLPGIAALHVVEHLPSSYLVQLISRCREKIQPGGLLVLESPNPRNLITSASEFYLDLTHRNPIHPQALAHLVTALGFSSIDTKDLNPPPPEAQFRLTSGETQDLETENENWRRLNSLLYGARDYAVIATK